MLTGDTDSAPSDDLYMNIERSTSNAQPSEPGHGLTGNNENSTDLQESSANHGSSPPENLDNESGPSTRSGQLPHQHSNLASESADALNTAPPPSIESLFLLVPYLPVPPFINYSPSIGADFENDFDSQHEPADLEMNPDRSRSHSDAADDTSSNDRDEEYLW